MDRLQYYCPSPKHLLRWPAGTIAQNGEVPRAGDVGYFEEGEGGGVTVWKTVGNAVGGGEVELGLRQYGSVFGLGGVEVEKIGRMFRCVVALPTFSDFARY